MSYIFPVILLSVIAMALFKRVPVFECFLRGAKSGLTVLLEITPVIVGFVAMIEVMKASGLFDVFSSLIAPAADFLGFPLEIHFSESVFGYIFLLQSPVPDHQTEAL